jgi:hypothetical protein
VVESVILMMMTMTNSNSFLVWELNIQYVTRCSSVFEAWKNEKRRQYSNIKN